MTDRVFKIFAEIARTREGNRTSEVCEMPQNRPVWGFLLGTPSPEHIADSHGRLTTLLPRAAGQEAGLYED